MPESYLPGDRVIFKPTRGAKREGTVEAVMPYGGVISIVLDGDPFAVDVAESQVSACNRNRSVVKSKKKVLKSRASSRRRTNPMTTTKMSSRERREHAKSLGIKNVEDLGVKELVAAIAKAEAKTSGSTTKDRPRSKPKTTAAKPAKSTKKVARKAAPVAEAPRKAKAAAKKVSAVNGSDGVTLPKGRTPKSIPADGANPFRRNSNLHLIANLLLKGGTRRSLATKLSEKVDLHPYHKDAGEIDLNDFDKRLVLGAQTMRDQFGYGVQRLGRGIDGRILVFVPGSDKDPRGAEGTGQKASRKARSKAAGKAR